MYMYKFTYMYENIILHSGYYTTEIQQTVTVNDTDNRFQTDCLTENQQLQQNLLIPFDNQIPR